MFCTHMDTSGDGGMLTSLHTESAGVLFNEKKPEMVWNYLGSLLQQIVLLFYSYNPELLWLKPGALG